MSEEKVCVCGHPESQHIDNCDECGDLECGCMEFEEATEDDYPNDMDDDSDEDHSDPRDNKNENIPPGYNSEGQPWGSDPL